jgi:hypothetical protein
MEDTCKQIPKSWVKSIYIWIYKTKVNIVIFYLQMFLYLYHLSKLDIYLSKTLNLWWHLIESFHVACIS